MYEATDIPAAVRYKEITASAEAAAQRLREHEATKATRLDEEVTAARQRAEEADEQCERVTGEVNRLWNMAMSALWEERWMRVNQMPEGDPSAAPERPKQSKDRVGTAYNELSRTLKKSGWSSRSLLQRRRESE